MKPFYVIIKISPNELSGDSIAIGLISYSDDEYRIKLSKSKIRIAKSLLSIETDIISFVNGRLRNALKIENANLRNEPTTLKLFPSSKNLNLDYFYHLNQYSNGALKFSKPKVYPGSITDEVSNKLLATYVENNKAVVKPKSDKRLIDKEFKRSVNHNLIMPIKDRVHVNYKIRNSHVPYIPDAFQIDCIGINGELIGAKSISFTMGIETIEKHVKTYISIIAHLSAKYEKRLNMNNFFLIADQPDLSLIHI